MHLFPKLKDLRFKYMGVPSLFLAPGAI